MRATSTSLPGFLRWRETPGFGRLEIALLAIYCTLLALTLPYHEPWGDEAQAWMIARDNTYWNLFRHRLHYEGSPGLWHSLLRLLHLAHVPYSALGWCCAPFAIAGIYVWLRWSPLPLVLRALFPFTFFLQYQYAVVARSYVLFPLLVFTLCALFCARQPRAVWFAVVAGLLANLCMQGTVFAFVLGLLYIWKLRQQVRFYPISRSHLKYAAAVFAAALLAAVYTPLPAPDAGFILDGQMPGQGFAHSALEVLVGETPRNMPQPTPDFTPEQWAARQLDAVPPKPDRFTAPRQWLAWQFRAPVAQRSFSDGADHALYGLVETPTILFWGFAVSNILAACFLAAILYWAWHRRGLSYFLPALALWVVSEFLWIADHHAGMLLVAFIAGVWLTANNPGGHSPSLARNRIADLTLISVTTLVFLLQIGWTVHTIRSDRKFSYDPSAETASFLHQFPSQTHIAAFHFWAVGIEPFFRSNPFFNFPTTWWPWCSNTVLDANHRAVIASHPDVVVFTYEHPLADTMRNQIIPLNSLTGLEPEDPIVTDLREHGYTLTHHFCGMRFSRMSAAYTVCDDIYQPPVSQALPQLGAQALRPTGAEALR